MLIHTTTYNFTQALALAEARILAHFTSFSIDTEFGSIFFEVTKNAANDLPYRYSTTGWNNCPVTKATEGIIRDSYYDHYVEIAPITESLDIMQLTLAMAMGECLVRYCTGNEHVSQDTADFVAASFMRNKIYSQSPYGLTHEYMKTVRTGGIFKSGKFAKCDRVTEAFMGSFFRNVIDKYNTLLRKNNANFDEKTHEVRIELSDDAYQTVFKHLFREARISTIKPESTIASNWRMISAADTSIRYTLPDAMRLLISGKRIED